MKKKGFKNNSGIFNEEIFYYHGQVRIVHDKRLAQGKIIEVTNSKAGPKFFIIGYNLNHVYGLEANIFKRSSFLKVSGETF